MFDTEIKLSVQLTRELRFGQHACLGTHMVCMYGKILTSILRIDVDMTSRTACD